MNSNVSTFEEMGQLALIITMGENELARDIVTKAAGCKVELDHLNLRIGVYDRVPIQMWRLLGKGMATSCLNLGNDLIQPPH